MMVMSHTVNNDSAPGCLTSGGPRVRIPRAVAHAGEELVDLFQRQRVVQRLQRIDGGHHGAAFEACGAEERHDARSGQTSDLGSTGGGRTAPVTPKHTSALCSDVLLPNRR